MTKNDPKYGENSHSIEEQQVLILCHFGHSCDLTEIVYERKAFHNFD